MLEGLPDNSKPRIRKSESVAFPLCANPINKADENENNQGDIKADPEILDAQTESKQHQYGCKRRINPWVSES
jgi:hypothetical protein